MVGRWRRSGVKALSCSCAPRTVRRESPVRYTRAWQYCTVVTTPEYGRNFCLYLNFVARHIHELHVEGWWWYCTVSCVRQQPAAAQYISHCDAVVDVCIAVFMVNSFHIHLQYSRTTEKDKHGRNTQAATLNAQKRLYSFAADYCLRFAPRT